MDTDITIRKAKASDAPGLAELYVQFWSKHKGIDPLLELRKKPTIKNFTEDVKKDIKRRNNYIFIALKDKKIIGYIETNTNKNYKLFKVKRYGWIDTATTHKNYRGRGVARALTDYAIKFFKKKRIKYVRATVYIRNKGALEAWKRMGFKPNSVRLLKEI